MGAFVVVHLKIKDPEKFQAYGGPAGPTVKAHGGEVVLKGAIKRVTSGEHGFERAVIIKFPDLETANRWHDSPEYQALIPMRNAGADVLMMICEEPPS